MILHIDPLKVQARSYREHQPTSLFPYIALTLHSPIDEKARNRFFSTRRSCNYIMTGTISFLMPPYAREEKNNWMSSNQTRLTVEFAPQADALSIAPWTLGETSIKLDLR